MDPGVDIPGPALTWAVEGVDKLGLTPAGLSALGWRIVDERPAPVLPLPGAS